MGNNQKGSKWNPLGICLPVDIKVHGSRVRPTLKELTPWSWGVHLDPNPHHTIRWGPYIGGNLPKVRSRYCPYGILPGPSWTISLDVWAICPDRSQNCGRDVNQAFKQTKISLLKYRCILLSVSDNKNAWCIIIDWKKSIFSRCLAHPRP